MGDRRALLLVLEESEFHALTLSAARLIFTIDLVDGFGLPLMEGPIVYSDSSAARGIANRKGVGKLKYLQVRSLWFQQARLDGLVVVDRVDTLLNTADLGTKFLEAARRKQLIGMLFLREHERRLWRVVDGWSAKDVSRR